MRSQEARCVRCLADLPRSVSVEEAAAHHVFLNSFIPRRLDEVAHFERDAARLAAGADTEGIYLQTTTGLPAAGAAPSTSSGSEPSDAGASSGEEELDKDGAPRTWAARPEAPGRDEVRAKRKANKEAVKEAQRVKRLTKTPKHVKRRATKSKH